MKDNRSSALSVTVIGTNPVLCSMKSSMSSQCDPLCFGTSIVAANANSLNKEGSQKQINITFLMTLSRKALAEAVKAQQDDQDALRD
jgi:hypothetical protein